MANITRLDKRIGDIAIEKKYTTRDKIERAVVIQGCIFKRTKVHMPIGKVLKTMGLLTEEQLNEILQTQKYQDAHQEETVDEDSEMNAAAIECLNLSVSKDRLHAYLAPTDKDVSDIPLDLVKTLLQERGIVQGIVEDKTLSVYLAQKPLPLEPFEVASGIPPVPGKPPDIVYHFDTDPMRIGTLKADGSIDWKDRGQIPQVKTGDLLAEKVNGDPGKPGIDVYDNEVPPPRIRQERFKCGKGAQRSEDGNQVIAKADGTPKLNANRSIEVLSVLTIDSDIGVETGHVDFDGYIEVNGSVRSGYRVNSKSLRTTEIQDATIELSEDLVVAGGIYGSKIKVGGTLKASHIHNSTIEVVGELVVEKEIFDSTIETNNRCLIGNGIIIASKVDAKKGIQAREIGTRAAKPCELHVGFDLKYERDMQAYKDELAELEQDVKDKEAELLQLQEKSDKVNHDLGEIAQEQDSYMVQKRQFEEKLNAPNIVDDEEERGLLTDLIRELDEKNATIDEKVQELMAQDDEISAQIFKGEKMLKVIERQTSEIKENMSVLEETLKIDPGIPVVKVMNNIFSKTIIKSPNSKIKLPEDMRHVRIAESKISPNAKVYEMKISSLR